MGKPSLGSFARALALGSFALAPALGCGAAGHPRPTTEAEGSPPEVAVDPEPPSARAATCAIEGSWNLVRYPGMDAVGPNGERPIAIRRDTTFAEGRFHVQGYPELVIEGRYRVEADGDARRVVMTEVVFDGGDHDDESHAISFGEGCDELTMGDSVYARAPR